MDDIKAAGQPQGAKALTVDHVLERHFPRSVPASEIAASLAREGFDVKVNSQPSNAALQVKGSDQRVRSTNYYYKPLWQKHTVIVVMESHLDRVTYLGGAVHRFSFFY